MTSQPASVQSLKEFTKQVPSSADLATVLLDLNREKNARARAITLAALLDSALEAALRTKLIPNIPKEDDKNLFGSGGTLGSFSVKIRMTYVLGVIGPETRADLDCIREIRNAFAHAKTIISFDTKEVSTVCQRLKFPLRHLFNGYKPPASPMDRYVITTTMLMQILRSLPTLANNPLLTPAWLPLIQK